MPYIINFIEDQGIVTITNTGKVTHEDFVKQTQEAIELARMKETGLFLSELTHLTNKITTLEIFRFPEIYEGFGVSRASRLAVLIPGAEKCTSFYEDMNFFETVCQNRGWVVRIFNDRDAAVEWLLS